MTHLLTSDRCHSHPFSPISVSSQGRRRLGCSVSPSLMTQLHSCQAGEISIVRCENPGERPSCWTQTCSPLLALSRATRGVFIWLMSDDDWCPRGGARGFRKSEFGRSNNLKEYEFGLLGPEGGGIAGLDFWFLTRRGLRVWTCESEGGGAWGLDPGSCGNL